jgi:hypothetical protein
MKSEDWQKQLPVQHAVQEIHDVITQMHDGLLLLIQEEPFDRMKYMHLMSLGGAIIQNEVNKLDAGLLELIKSRWTKEETNEQHDDGAISGTTSSTG